ncbi:hypothetical protein BC940DRAFT_323612 [Gongronella butleri]|nr:hypothetical protein BC940DRAFT_323612 [Gongronella butleri]
MSSIEGENIFAPTEDREALIERVKELEKRLQEQEAKEKALRHELAEEKLAYLITTNFANAIIDPTREKAIDMEELQETLVSQMVCAAEARFSQDIIAKYRLAGQTVFDFHGQYTGVRLETFYKQRYYEPYYLFITKDPEEPTIHRHTLPDIIPVERLARRFLARDRDSFLRMVHDLLLVFIAKREEKKELEASES